MESISSKIKKESFMSKEENEEKNFTNERWENGLTLRKRKINEILSKKRGFDRFKNEGQKDYQIIKEEINIPIEIKNKKYDDLDQFLKEIKVYIQSENIEYNKYALYCIRTQTLNNEGSNNKNLFSELLIKQDYIVYIFNLIQKYFDNKKIIYEALWILINILYYQNNNVDLVVNLSTQQCIQLYIKILDKKDNCLRLNIYWLLSNLLNNTNIGLTNQVLFHLYMSSLFRLYIIKDLEDNNSNLAEIELMNLILILSFLSDFVNDTFVRLKNNDIKNFLDYNSNVDYQSIMENNKYLLEHLFNIFLKYIENANLNCYCFMGLSKLTNYLDDQIIFNKLFLSGLCRKLVKEQIKVDEEFINYVVQIIGNYLYFIPENLIDPIFVEETFNYFVKLLQSYPSKQILKRDIFWSASNIVVDDNNYCELFAKSGILLLGLQSICTDNDTVINEALYMLLGFFDINNIEIIINNNNLDYIKNLVSCLKNIHSKCTPGEAYKNKDIVHRALCCITSLFEIGNILKTNGLINKFIKDFEKNGGFELLEMMLSESNLSKDCEKLAENLLSVQNYN